MSAGFSLTSTRVLPGAAQRPGASAPAGRPIAASFGRPAQAQARGHLAMARAERLLLALDFDGVVCDSVGERPSIRATR